ncbi:uncharacterized protein LOC124178209 isoform X1 [Neodiprion fabricii]|uniref:uncharacterized protein LOC124178209 isoform X1 n=1 Tax=Neodiprion fabricii TaxID=2872261 RepID=UPI001ED930FE|nr:uncharacterized protein LOC124178209 isoform X1 [Neodiprion fabricii]
MENRPAPLRSRRVCRFCLTESEPLSFIYEKDHSKPFQVPLTLQIMSCVAIEVYAADGMPQMICSVCRWNLDRSYKFKIQCKKADEALRAYPVSGVLPRPFPALPSYPPDVGNNKTPDQRSQNDQSKKPRLEEGERERRERERDWQSDKQSDNMDHHDMYDEQDGGSDGGNESPNEKDGRKLEPGEIRVHACDQCDRTFPLRQALQLHIQRAHRDRNYKCTECDKLFFTKYDLSKHATTHSEVKPFTCQICHKQFARISLLQRHEKIHRDELRYGCQHCDREFFNTDDLEKHEATVHKSVKPYQCNICNKRFTYKQGLERHELLHSDDKNFICEYCKEAFRSSTKLAKHLTTHAGHRPFLCKLCPRSFLLSHHLTRHMRTHSVEKPHACEECGKAFKRKESLEVHQLTHAKRGMGLTCEICQESCRNRADYVTHIKQHIEAGEKMGPDGLRPEIRKEKIDSESEEEEEEEEDTDGDDDYEPPASVTKKIPKHEPPESDEEMEKSDRKEQVVYVRNKDGNLVKKTIKTLMPIHRREIQDVKGRSTPSGSQSAKIVSSKSEVRSVSSDSESTPKLRTQHRMDDTEAEVQKIVASVFKEHKIPFKHQNIPQEQSKDSPTTANLGQSRSQHGTPASASNQLSTSNVAGPTPKEEVSKTDALSATPKSVNTVKVIKRIVVRKGGAEGAQALASSIKESETPTSTPGSATKVTKRVIVRRIIRQGDTTREVIMNPDGTILDPAELAKLPTRNVVKRVVVKKPKDKLDIQGHTLLQVAEDLQQSVTLKTSTLESKLTDPKFELKTSQLATSTSQGDVKPSSTQLKSSDGKTVLKGSDMPVTSTDENEENPESTKVKLEKLEKRVEQQRLKIEELQARKNQEVESVEDMLPERQDESEEEQQLPLKRVFVKRKQSVFDEEKEYDSDEKDIVTIKKEKLSQDSVSTLEMPKRDYKKPIVTSTSKVYGNKKIILVKTEESQHVDDNSMSRELSSILDSSENVMKMQDNVLGNFSQISALEENIELKLEGDKSMEEDPTDTQEAAKTVEDKTRESLLEDLQAGDKSEDEIMHTQDETGDMVEIQISESTVGNEETQPDSSLSLDGQEGTEPAEVFVGSDSGLHHPKTEVPELEESVIELADETINLHDSNETQDSIEDKLSQLDS